MAREACRPPSPQRSPAHYAQPAGNFDPFAHAVSAPQRTPRPRLASQLGPSGLHSTATPGASRSGSRTRTGRPPPTLAMRRPLISGTRALDALRRAALISSCSAVRSRRDQPDLPARVLTHQFPPRSGSRARDLLSALRPRVGGSSCCQQHPARQHADDPPPITRPEPQHPRPRRDRDRLQRVRDAAPGRQHRAELHIQRDRATREMRPASSARSANRRSQPRTVSACTPNREAIRRYPCPATIASIAAPITAISSRRRNNATSASSTCVPAHPRHRARRGRSHRSPDEQRSTRSRA